MSVFSIYAHIVVSQLYCQYAAYIPCATYLTASMKHSSILKAKFQILRACIRNTELFVVLRNNSTFIVTNKLILNVNILHCEINYIFLNYLPDLIMVEKNTSLKTKTKNKQNKSASIGGLLWT